MQTIHQLRRIKALLPDALRLNGDKRLSRIMPLLDAWEEDEAPQKSKMEKDLKNAKTIKDAFETILRNKFAMSLATANRQRKKAGFKSWT
jgi:hypothetical protein